MTNWFEGCIQFMWVTPSGVQFVFMVIPVGRRL